VLQKTTRQLLSSEAARFLLVGSWNTLFGYGLFALFTWLLTDRLPYAYMFGAALAHVISVSVAFLGHRRFVFRSTGRLASEFLKCHLVYAASFLINFALLPVLVAAFHATLGPQGYVPYLAGAVLIAGSTVLSFFGHKHFSFAAPRERAPRREATDDPARPRHS
jgi:putative flippase GtrA